MITTVSSTSPSRSSSASPAETPHRSASINREATQQRRSVEPTVEKDETQARTTTGGKRELTDEERLQVEELKRIDAHVRQHEAAHQAAAGGLARGKSFTYKQGPDGNQYAVAGEVQIDTSAVPNDPQATIAKMQRVRAAASAPSDPSSQDRAVAAQAGRTAAEARAELSAPEEQEIQPANGATAQVIPGEAIDTADAGVATDTEEDTERNTERRIDSPARQQGNPYSAVTSPDQPSYKERGIFINTYA